MSRARAPSSFLRLTSGDVAVGAGRLRRGRCGRGSSATVESSAEDGVGEGERERDLGIVSNGVSAEVSQTRFDGRAQPSLLG